MTLIIETGQENPILRTPGTSVKNFNAKLNKLAKAMHTTMTSSEGVGLAGPQIGKAIHLFIADSEQMPQELCEATRFADGAIAIANPLLLNMQDAEKTIVEGCLSLPGILVEIQRPETITIQGQNLEGRTFTITISGYAARILQHEMDHLNGTLIVDKGKIVDAEGNAL